MKAEAGSGLDEGRAGEEGPLPGLGATGGLSAFANFLGFGTGRLGESTVWTKVWCVTSGFEPPPPVPISPWLPPHLPSPFT